MHVNRIEETRKKLTAEHEALLKSVSRHRLAAVELTTENTEDEGDLAHISHNRELSYHLHETDFLRLKSIERALKAIERGVYGECVRCGEDINEKRLTAVPWATLCIGCQEELEKEAKPANLAMAGFEVDEPDSTN